MHTFLSDRVNDREILLDPSESAHAVRVLRLHGGDEVRVVDGKGNIYHGVIKETNPQRVRISVTEHTHLKRRAPYYLHIAIAPPRNMGRFEVFLEKAVEAGIDEITPLLCTHSERNKVRMERMEKITVAAMKQSGQPFLPVLNPMTSFSDFIQRPFPGTRLIAHCCTHEKATSHMQEALASPQILLLIGPEGDFSREELALAFRHHYTPVSLGHARLRTETAGIAATVIAATHFFRHTE